MKSFFALALPLLAAAAPAPITEPRADADANPNFSVMAVRSASPIHYTQLNAAGQKFWLGGNTASYCPHIEGLECPPGNQTVLAPGGGSLDVEVPASPPGSAVGGLSYVPGKPWAHYTFNGWNATGLMACPTEDNRWQVFAAMQNATVPQGNVGDCLGFSALALTYKGDVPAWQYI
ncbi:hypothetical protein N7509_008429 [Penicillium cosmopolitanum]|uniref:IgE-binding protein n=1 Tax=Penicillium cosmopolitanum TaxID=1131564 RepID=A0A9W9VMK0_9EURO|nr:uncharacterized protein N7509_008429 [Penicillium cosmopolitanum]KAJ5385888.1 hypothetical protein N7509_008429 [Penicillium cosmopolitanum]